MQSVHSRLRRVVEKENRGIGTKIGNGNKSRRKQRRRQFNVCLLLIVLTPIAIIGSAIYVLEQADSELENLTTGKTGTTKHEIVSPEDALKKSKRLRNSLLIEEDNAANIHREENRIVSKAETRRKMKGQHQKKEGVEETKNDKPGSKYLILTTKHGNIKITLRPDLSKGSVDYIYQLVKSYGGNGNRCMHCNFYRADEQGILQGIMEHEGVVPVNNARGSCPPGAEGVSNDCPEWDMHCGCHGPVMTRGAVAWAAGDAGGPDFFIDGYKEPAKWWGTQHTNFGFIEDEASLSVIDAIFKLPTELEEGMEYLKEAIHFDLILE